MATKHNSSTDMQLSDEQKSPRPTARESIMKIEAYVPGKSSVGKSGNAHSGEQNPLKIHKLSSNETPFGPSSSAIEAYAQAAKTLATYPEGSSKKLREAIGQKWGINPEQIICGAGSDELLSLTAYTLMNPHDEGIFTEHGFLVYKIAIMAAGGTAVIASEKHFKADVDDILSRISPQTKIIYIANPNNPTGTYLCPDEMKRLHAGIPSNVLLVIDGAYAEYVAGEEEASLSLAQTFENVVISRTFSKVYGLAAARLGWMYGAKHMIDAMNRIRGPFNVSTAAMDAGVAALQDTAHLQKSVAHNTLWREWLTREITALGLAVTPSQANFILIHFPNNNHQNASIADEYLSERGLILRRVSAYGLPQCLRLSVGSQDANEALVSALSEFMKQAEHD